MIDRVLTVFRDRDQRNVLVLATCQMLFGSGRSLLIATAPLIAYGIAEHKGLATVPASLVVVGTALASMPASLFMRRVGRRSGFLAGCLIGALGGIVSGVAILEADFWLFSLGTLLFGFFAGFAQLYRFAAADAAPKDFRATAISLVLAGGVVAAFVGPELAKLGHDMFASATFFGAYLFLVATMVLSALVLMFLEIPPLTLSEQATGTRPLLTIMAQPVFIAATLSALIGQAVMNFLMTATPLAMAHMNHHFESTAFVIEWHIVGMFAPGFITGRLIRRFGELAIILTGFALQFACVAIALMGESVFVFWLSMLLLGIGWNFAFTGGTALLAEAHTPAERAKAQGATNVLIYTVVAIGSLSSGALLHYFGWRWVNLGALPFLAVAVIAMLWYGMARRSAVAAADSTT